MFRKNPLKTLLVLGMALAAIIVVISAVHDISSDESLWHTVPDEGL